MARGYGDMARWYSNMVRCLLGLIIILVCIVSNLHAQELDGNSDNKIDDALLPIGTSVQAYNAVLTTWAGITPGANVGTALAIAIGAEGAPILFNGVLGTPSSGTLTNCTEYPETGDVSSVLDDTGGTVPILLQASTAFSADDATPSVTGHSLFRTANANPTTITDFDNPIDGQNIWVLVNDAVTTFSFSTGIEGYSTSFLADNGAVYHFYYDATDTNWHMEGVPSTISISAIYDTVPIVDADAVTKKMTFNVGAVTAGQTRDVFVPDVACSLVADSEVSATGIITDFALATNADVGDYDITSIDKLEGIDATEYIDLGADGYADIYAGTEVRNVSALVSISADATVGDDLTLKSDSAVLGFGADTDVTLTHVADTGLTLNVATFTTAAATDPYLLLNETDGTDFYLGVDDTGNEIELRTSASLETGVLIKIEEDGDFVLEGDTDDTSEMTIHPTDPTADRTITLPNYTGSVPLLVLQEYDTVTLSEITEADVTGSTVTLEDGYFTSGKVLKYVAGGTNTGANGTISVILDVEGADAIKLTTADGAAGDWVCEITLVSTGAATQRLIGTLHAEGGAETIIDYATTSVDTAAAGTIPVVLQLDLGHADDSMTCDYVQVWMWDKADAD